MLKKLIAKLFIPKKSPYCHHKFKKDKYNNIYAKPCHYFCRRNNMEYCKYLKDYLSIQDQVKDCGINEDYEESD